MKKLLLMFLMCAPIAAFAQKFGHVNAQEIIQVMPDYTKAKNEIDALQKQYEDDLKSMQDELTKKSQAYERSRPHCPTTSNSAANRNSRRCIRRYSRATKTTSRPSPRLLKRRCRP